MVNTGNKRKSQSKRKSSTDFKRLKGKVGKKVAKSPNETETTFRKANLYIASQAIKSNCPESILSGKGKSIHDLFVQFGHHAGVARKSALNGLISIVKENETIGLRALLHGLVQVASKALVDDEPTVRKTAFLLLNEIVTRFEKSSLVPFTPLIIAYTSSAMHSLDRSMRCDGAYAVGLVTSVLGPPMRDSVASLLPPFVNLLSDRENSKYIGRLLEALVSLLSILDFRRDGPSSPSQHQRGQNDENHPNFCVRAGSQSRNTFLQLNRRIPHSFDLHCSLPVILSAPNHVALDQPDNIQQPITVRIPSKLLREIQIKLCDLLDEVTDEETENYSYAEKGKLSFQELKLLMQAIRLVYSARLATRCDDSDPLDPCHFRTANLLVDLFPTNVNRAFCLPVARDAEDSMNSSITRTLLTIACFTNDFHASKGWIERLLSFWLPFFEKKDGKGLSTMEVQVIHEMLQALSSISGLASSCYSDRLYEELCKKFFNEPDAMVARSLAGRNAATIVATRYAYNATKLEQSVLKSHIFVAFITALPLYLKAWSPDFEREISGVLDALRSCVTCGDDLVRDFLRDNVFAILDHDVSATSGLAPFIEDCSVNLQRKFLELIRAIGKPAPHVLKGLAACCMGHKSVSVDVGLCIDDDVVVSIGSIRKTIPMTNYVTFLVVTMGVPRAGSELSTDFDEGTWESFLISLDRRVSRGGKAIIDCGSYNCLRMVAPQLLTWMEVPEEDVSIITVLRNRASLCVLSMLLVDLKKTSIQVNGLLEVLGLVEKCCEVSIHLVRFLAKSVNLNEHIRDQLLSPLVTLVDMDLKFALRLTHVPAVMQKLATPRPRDNHITSSSISLGLQE